MAPPVSILTLPYEVRYEIYRHYFTLDEGYALEPGPSKLAAADGQPLDLALIYTCRLIADEAHDLPLRFNTVSFSTVYHQDWRSWAGRFHYQFSLQLSIQSDLLVRMAHHVSPDMYAQIALKFPRFVPMLRHAVGEGEGGVPRTARREERSDFEIGPYRGLNDFSRGQARWAGWRESVSMVGEAVAYTLRLLAQSHGPELTQLLNKELPRREASQDMIGFLDKCYEPWAVPPQSDLAAVGFELADDRVWDNMAGWHKEDIDHRRYRERFRFSAAAVAIRFLDSLPIKKRLQMRKMVLHEDHVAVAYQERHARGLIPFCRENRHLRIERRVDLLNTLLQKPALNNLISLPISSRHEPNNRYDLSSLFITPTVAEWLLEGLATVDAGMPANAFTLVLSSGPAADLGADVFQRVVHRDLAWQTALEQCYSQGILPTPSNGLHEYTFCDISPDFRRAMEHLVHQTSILRCDFNPGQFWDVGKLLDECRSWNRERWQTCRFVCRDPRSFQVTPPPPDWGDALLENFDMEPERARSKGHKRHRVTGRRQVRNA